MWIYRISNLSNCPLNIDELLSDARQHSSYEDFSDAFSVKKNLLECGKTSVNSDNTVTLYHVTTSEISNKILEEGLFKGRSSPTGGMTGLELGPSSFFGTDRDWVKNTWGSGRAALLEIKVPVQYIRQPAQNCLEVYFEGGLKRSSGSSGSSGSGDLWVPIDRPRDTFYNTLPVLDHDWEYPDCTLQQIWDSR